MKQLYHSALKGFKEYQTESLGFKSKHIETMLFDVENDIIPHLFRIADFVFLEPPYRHGYDVFNQRVGKTDGIGYDKFVEKIFQILDDLNKPFYIIAEKKFPAPEEVNRTKIHYSAHNMETTCYSNRIIPENTTTDKLKDFLFTYYNVGLDFMCGYGNLGVAAKQKKKHAILADYNPKCLGYIYENLQQ